MISVQLDIAGRITKLPDRVRSLRFLDGVLTLVVEPPVQEVPISSFRQLENLLAITDSSYSDLDRFLVESNLDYSTFFETVTESQLMEWLKNQ